MCVCVLSKISLVCLWKSVLAWIFFFFFFYHVIVFVLFSFMCVFGSIVCVMSSVKLLFCRLRNVLRLYGWLIVWNCYIHPICGWYSQLLKKCLIGVRMYCAFVSFVQHTHLDYDEHVTDFDEQIIHFLFWKHHTFMVLEFVPKYTRNWFLHCYKSKLAQLQITLRTSDPCPDET